MAKYYDRFYDTDSKQKRWRSELADFLGSTMDEPRVQRSQHAARTALQIYDVAELLHLRRDVLKREALGNIAYSGQRDHTAHTFNNWLLGWWLLQSSGQLREAMEVEFEWRGLLDWNGGPFYDTFGDLWQAVSLLHDIGYILEGAVSVGSLVSMSEHVKAGAVLVEEFFSHSFMFDSGIRSAAMRETVFERLGNLQLQFMKLSHGNLAAMAQELAVVDKGIGSLRDWAVEEEDDDLHLRNARDSRIPNPNSRMIADTFDLWAASYRHFRRESMAKRIESLRAVFRRYALHGIDDGPRVLDHAVCSGLIVFHHSTLYYLLYRALEIHAPTFIAGDEVFDEMRLLRAEMRRFDYNPYWWWAGIAWATSAAGLHNVCQAGELGKLRLAEDPLAYLGILVDAIQHWDRYAVARGGALGVKNAVEGNRVLLGEIGGKPAVRYENKRRAADARDELNRSLSGWQHLISVG